MPRTHAVVLGLVLGGLALVAPRAAADDAAFTSRGAKRAQKQFERATASAEKTYASRIRSAQRDYEKQLRRVQKDVMRDGDLDEAKTIEAVLGWLAESQGSGDAVLSPNRARDDHELGSPAAQAAQGEYGQAIEAAIHDFELGNQSALQAYEEGLQDALQSAMRSGDLPEAEAINAALERVQTRLDAMASARQWVVLFRSANPADWDTAVEEDGRFAIPLARAPQDARFVRLRRMDDERYVILEVSTEALGQDGDGAQFTWVGGKTLNEGGVHLGIDNAAWKLTFRDGGRIMVSNRRSTAGWGFGHKVHTNDVQYWSWAGQEIPETVFEIAVTSRELSEAERKALLVASDAD